MKIDHHTVLNAVTRAIMLCDIDPREAQEGLYALGDYLKHFYAADARSQTEPTAEDIERIQANLATLQEFLQKRFDR
jgi:hypothetical protein